MILAKIAISGKADSLVIEWDTSPIIRELTRLRLLHDDSAKGVIVIGDNLTEYTLPLIHELRRLNALVVLDAQAVRENLVPSEIASSYREEVNKLGNIIPHNVGDDVKSKLASMNSSDMSVSEYFELIIKPTKIFKKEFYESYISSLTKKISNGIFVYAASRADLSLTYFDVLIPAISKISPDTVWLLFGDGEVARSTGFRRMERDYVTWDQIVDGVAFEKGVDAARLKLLLETTLPPPPRFSRKSASKISGAFARHFFSYYSDHINDDLTINTYGLPKPLSAPIEFLIGSGKLQSSMRRIDGVIKDDESSTVLNELISQINDITSVYNLSNSAPIISQKMNRLKLVLNEIIENPTGPSVIRAGILNGSIRDQLKFEVDNIEESAHGGIHSAVRQTDLFLNRLRAWREYLWEVDRPQNEIEKEVIQKASDVINEFKSPSTMHSDASREINGYLKDISDGKRSGLEGEGIVRMTQNMLAVVAGYLHSQVKKGISDSPGKVVGDGVKYATIAAMVTVILKLEPTIISLAKTHPSMFGWLLEFISWVKVVV